MTLWLKAAGIRAAKTFAQTILGLLIIGQAFYEVNWVQVLSVALLAAVISLLTSVKGLPELTTDGDLNIKVSAKTGKVTYDLGLNDEIEKLAEKSIVSFKVIK